MQKFLSLLFSRRALAVVGVLVLALLVWFVGPLVSFDTLCPLASVGSRVVTIALLLMLLVLWLVNWSMSIIGISVLCLAIGFVTPLLALGDVHPFAPLWVRLTLIGFILLMYALYGLYRLWRALRMDEQLLRRFLHPRGEEVPVAGEIKADLRTVNHIVTQAIRQLRQLRVDMPGWRKIFEGKRFLYELPWFMVVGSPGDGKTTALLNTGLQFPLAEQMEQTSRILTVPGGGTLHCDWWFTNEAVLIDTAGRYARHDDGGEVSAAQRNAGEWQGFLGLLRKHRPGAPLNGVILTLNVADLTAQSPAERLAACAALRARLADLRETLGIRFPVYLVVTKMDLLPGFSDYFRTLTSHLRAQIWGFSLPYSRRRKAGDPQALHAACAQELARLTLRLDQGLDTRLQEEYDLKSRQRLYTFPREFAALGEPLLEAIEQIFLDSKFDATQLNNTLRGVFFTSAAQAQADAVADQLSIWQRFVRAIKTARGESSTSLPHALPDGNRSYFLHDLLTQFIFREAHLVEPNLQWAWRYRLLRLGGHLLVLVLAFLLWQGMQTSQQTNGDYLNEISARATRLDGEVKAYTGKPAMAPVPALLDSARELSAWPELDPDAPPLTWRYGLYSVPPVTDSVASLYNRLLDQLLLPPLVKRMEYVLADAIDGRYPFADSPQEVSAEDFNRIFASGGVLDAFWSKQLAPLADTASDPWRYKPTEGNMTLQGPDLTPFQQAKQIRSVFFNSEGGKKFSWSMQISVVDMDPAITELVIDIDGQVLRYAHGPDRPLKVTWPGPRNGSMAEITASPRIRQDTSTLLTGGPWALFHLLDAGMVQETAVRGRQLVEYDFDGRRVVLEITAGRDFNPVSRELLQNFSCPARAL
ncbi:type VI secretion system membrane subunit TssM [Salmonella enterica]|uniref:Type VI secretion system membrane subunit TssM n=2 Tax=Salmonella enterica TaxID=28901 RepID=A0A5V0QEZ7_SALER|nr:type VI secretion system membrane subunit TssM [Salmonella enterica]ECS7051831.1 type VI secretion system membrane subunit TssM [Salmonella enterica subsp. enterica serovar Oranienburg]EEA7970235.1 type VI secretion system membrane subunit TssM [Salmonella enterica subsp. enterica]EAP3579260.1 type VI secretion system membrane subunit TssM [Salmonella enterica]EAP9802275.1 type VI secretion system membrane subunit TssM [Salmonella enterica]